MELKKDLLIPDLGAEEKFGPKKVSEASSDKAEPGYVKDLNTIKTTVGQAGAKKSVDTPDIKRLKALIKGYTPGTDSVINYKSGKRAIPEEFIKIMNETRGDQTVKSTLMKLAEIKPDQRDKAIELRRAVYDARLRYFAKELSIDPKWIDSPPIKHTYQYHMDMWDASNSGYQQLAIVFDDASLASLTKLDDTVDANGKALDLRNEVGQAIEEEIRKKYEDVMEDNFIPIEHVKEKNGEPVEINGKDVRFLDSLLLLREDNGYSFDSNNLFMLIDMNMGRENHMNWKESIKKTFMIRGYGAGVGTQVRTMAKEFKIPEYDAQDFAAYIGDVTDRLAPSISLAEKLILQNLQNNAERIKPSFEIVMPNDFVVHIDDPEMAPITKGEAWETKSGTMIQTKQVMKFGQTKKTLKDAEPVDITVRTKNGEEAQIKKKPIVFGKNKEDRVWGQAQVEIKEHYAKFDRSMIAHIVHALDGYVAVQMQKSGIHTTHDGFTIPEGWTGEQVTARYNEILGEVLELSRHQKTKEGGMTKTLIEHMLYSMDPGRKDLPLVAKNPVDKEKLLNAKSSLSAEHQISDGQVAQETVRPLQLNYYTPKEHAVMDLLARTDKRKIQSERLVNLMVSEMIYDPSRRMAYTGDSFFERTLVNAFEGDMGKFDYKGIELMGLDKTPEGRAMLGKITQDIYSKARILMEIHPTLKNEIRGDKQFTNIIDNKIAVMPSRTYTMDKMREVLSEQWMDLTPEERLKYKNDPTYFMKWNLDAITERWDNLAKHFVEEDARIAMEEQAKIEQEQRATAEHEANMRDEEVFEPDNQVNENQEVPDFAKREDLNNADAPEMKLDLPWEETPTETITSFGDVTLDMLPETRDGGSVIPVETKPVAKQNETKQESPQVGKPLAAKSTKDVETSAPSEPDLGVPKKKNLDDKKIAAEKYRMGELEQEQIAKESADFFNEENGGVNEYLAPKPEPKKDLFKKRTRKKAKVEEELDKPKTIIKLRTWDQMNENAKIGVEKKAAADFDKTKEGRRLKELQKQQSKAITTIRKNDGEWGRFFERQKNETPWAKQMNSARNLKRSYAAPSNRRRLHIKKDMEKLIGPEFEEKVTTHVLETNFYEIYKHLSVDNKALRGEELISAMKRTMHGKATNQTNKKLAEKYKYYIDAMSYAFARNENRIGGAVNNGVALAKEMGEAKPELVGELIDFYAAEKALSRVTKPELHGGWLHNTSNDGWDTFRQLVKDDKLTNIMKIIEVKDKRSRKLFSQNPEGYIVGWMAEAGSNGMKYDDLGRLVVDTGGETQEGIIPISKEENKIGSNPISALVKDKSGKKIKPAPTIEYLKSLYSERRKLNSIATQTNKVAGTKARDALGRSRKASEILAQTLFSVDSKYQTRAYTKSLLENDYSLLFSKEKKEDFVEVPKKTLQRFPKELRKEVRYVDAAAYDMIVGRKKTKMLFTDHNKQATVLGEVWRNFVTRFKQNNTIKNPASLINNAMVGITMNATMVKDPIKMMGYVPVANREIKHIKSLQAEIAAKYIRGEDIDSLRVELESNQLYQMEKLGLSTNTLDGLDETLSVLGKMTEQATDWMPDWMKTAGNNALMNEGSMLGDFMAGTFSEIDTASRYTLVRSLMDEGMTMQEGVDWANGFYADMDVMIPRIADTIDKMGIVPYLGWFLNSAPRTWELARRNPMKFMGVFASALMLEAALSDKDYKGNKKDKPWYKVGIDVTGKVGPTSLVDYVWGATYKDVYAYPKAEYRNVASGAKSGYETMARKASPYLIPGALSKAYRKYSDETMSMIGGMLFAPEGQFYGKDVKENEPKFKLDNRGIFDVIGDAITEPDYSSKIKFKDTRRK